MLDKLTISHHPQHHHRQLYLSHGQFQFHNHYFGTAARNLLCLLTVWSDRDDLCCMEGNIEPSERNQQSTIQDLNLQEGQCHL